MNDIFKDIRLAFSPSGSMYVKLVLINVFIFLGANIIMTTFQLVGMEWVSVQINDFFVLHADPNKFLYRPWTLITSCFWHRNDFWHLVSNMIFLYWFGYILEEFLGKKRVMSAYLLGGLAGSVVVLLAYNFIPIPAWKANLAKINLAGASDSVLAVVVAAATFRPNYVLIVYFIPIQIKYIALGFVVLSYIGLGGGNVGGQIAHIAGAVMGLLYAIQLQKGNDLGAWIHDFIDWVKALFRPTPKMRPSYKAKEKATVNQPKAKSDTQASSQTNLHETPNQDEIDALLDKISANGYDSLTKEEKQKLFKASKGE